MSIHDLRARYDLPDIREVTIGIRYHESMPVPCISRDARRHSDRIPDLPNLPAFLAAYEREYDRVISAVEVWVDGPARPPVAYDFSRQRR